MRNSRNTANSRECFKKYRKYYFKIERTRRNTLDFFVTSTEINKKKRYTTRQNLLSLYFFIFSVLPLGHRGMLIGIFIYFQWFHCFQRSFYERVLGIYKKLLAAFRFKYGEKTRKSWLAYFLLFC